MAVRTIIKGDVTGDGRINLEDIIMTRRYIVGSIDIVPWQKVAADVNNDGTVIINDLIAIRNHWNGTHIITEVTEYLE